MIKKIVKKAKTISALYCLRNKQTLLKWNNLKFMKLFLATI